MTYQKNKTKTKNKKQKHERCSNKRNFYKVSLFIAIITLSVPRCKIHNMMYDFSYNHTEVDVASYVNLQILETEHLKFSKKKKKSILKT